MARDRRPGPAKCSTWNTVNMRSVPRGTFCACISVRTTTGNRYMRLELRQFWCRDFGAGFRNGPRGATEEGGLCPPNVFFRGGERKWICVGYESRQNGLRILAGFGRFCDIGIFLWRSALGRRGRSRSKDCTRPDSRGQLHPITRKSRVMGPDSGREPFDKLRAGSGAPHGNLMPPAP